MSRAGKNLLKRHRLFFALSGLYILIAYFPLFLHLGTDTVHAWDESMFAMRAYQLANEGTFLENFGDYTAGFNNPNIKPPFGTYFQAIGLKLFNYNELGLRLPIAVFCLATSLMLIWFFYRYYSNALLGFLSAMVLVCSPGYVMPHVARTGDHEGVLVFLVLGGLLSLYRYIETGIPKWCYAAAVFFALGFLTKNLVAFFPLPAVLVYVLYEGKLKTLLTDKTVYKSLALFIAILVVQYALVFYISPYNFRFLGFGNVHDRFVNTVHGHAAPMGFYLMNLAKHKFLPWLYLLPLGIMVTQLKAYRQYRSLIFLLLGASISQLMVISLSKTKLPWYDASVYPWLAIIAALPLYALIDKIIQHWQPKRAMSIAITVALVSVVFGASYASEIKENLHHPITAPQQQVGSLLKKVRDEYPSLKSFNLIDNDHDGNLVASFYINSMNDYRGFDIKYQNTFNNIQIGDTIGFCSTKAITWADSLYTQQTLVYTNGCKVVVLEDSIRIDRTVQH